MRKLKLACSGCGLSMNVELPDNFRPEDFLCGVCASPEQKRAWFAAGGGDALRDAFDLDAPPKCAVCAGDVSAMHFDGPCDAWVDIEGVRVWLCSIGCAFSWGRSCAVSTLVSPLRVPSSEEHPAGGHWVLEAVLHTKDGEGFPDNYNPVRRNASGADVAALLGNGSSRT